MQGVLFLTQRHLRHLAVPLQRQQRVAVPVGRVVVVKLDTDADADELTLDAIWLYGDDPMSDNTGIPYRAAYCYYTHAHR